MSRHRCRERGARGRLEPARRLSSRSLALDQVQGRLGSSLGITSVHYPSVHYPRMRGSQAEPGKGKVGALWEGIVLAPQA